VPLVLSCVPGISNVARCDDGSYRATITAPLGPARVDFTGTVWCEAEPTTRTVTVLAKGRDRSGTTQVATAVRLVAEPDGARGGTSIDIRGEIEFAGRLAAAARIGGQGVADSLVRGLAERLALRLRGEVG
jgi:carbon monoxide dehydrogenase subunit G